VAESTLRVWTGLVAGFVAALGNEPDAYDAESIRRFVTERAEGRSVEHADTVVTVVRAFLRYLVAYGRVPAALVGAVPKVAKWKLSALPRYLSVEQVEAVIAACDPGSQVGARDRAMVLLMARLGLRAGDVVALCLDDLDWSGGRVRLVGKSRQQSWLPLPQEVGDAVLHYLQHARPRTRHERVFLRVNAPYVPLAESSAVTGVATRAMRRAGIDAPRLGAHVLRHSAATHALRDGATLETVAVLLRHSSLESTAHYAKVDVGLLREVAQPWPTLELSPC
jgi:site-specific recombinase XerD